MKNSIVTPFTFFMAFGLLFVYLAIKLLNGDWSGSVLGFIFCGLYIAAQIMGYCLQLIIKRSIDANDWRGGRY